MIFGPTHSKVLAHSDNVMPSSFVDFYNFVI